MRRALCITLVAFAAVLVGNALVGDSPRSPEPGDASAGISVDAAAVAGRLAEALRFRTISHKDEARVDRAPFEAMRAWLASAYPSVHDPRLVERYEVGEGQLFILRGSEPEDSPLLFLAHLDVVPAEAASAASWTRSPFGGEVADGFVWGRGALDDKSSAIALFEAMEHLLVAGKRPRRDLILAIGEDEEVLGLRGAALMAEWLAERNVRPLLVLDEGMALLDGAFDGVDPTVGLIGVTERGYATLELLSEAGGGHSSMPPERTAVFALSRALAELEANPMAAHIDGVVGELLERLSHEQPFSRRLVTSNRWLFNWVIKSRMEASPGTNAMLRTTFAPTVVRAGEVENALPTQARAWINVRVHPSDTLEAVLAHVREAVASSGVSVSLLDGACEPAPVSPASGEAWELIGRAIATVAPEAVQAPGLVVGATDSRHYAHLSQSVYRFFPLRLKPEDLPRIHGVDERIGVENLGEMVRFYLEMFLSP